VDRASVAADGAQANSGAQASNVSADGRFVAILSFSTNLVPGDTNGAPDVFVRDRQAGTTERVSVAIGGYSSGGSLREGVSAVSADGRLVAFESGAFGRGHVFVRDRQAGATEVVSVAPDGALGNGFSNSASLSADGRFVAFSSEASNLVPGDTNGGIGTSDVFVRDRLSGTTERVNVAPDGAQANGGSSFTGGISADGRFVAFQSTASNLVVGDTNGGPDVFVAERVEGGATPIPTNTPTSTPTMTPTNTPTDTPTATATTRRPYPTRPPRPTRPPQPTRPPRPTRLP
jgi:Tol biopolymer transport system component